MNDNIVTIVSENGEYRAVFSKELVDDMKTIWGMDVVTYTCYVFNNIFDSFKMKPGRYTVQMEKIITESKFTFSFPLVWIED